MKWLLHHPVRLVPIFLIAIVIRWPFEAAHSRDSVHRTPDLLLEQFGGVGDGRTDNLPAFALAIAALGSKGNGTIQDGGCIILGAGTYVISGSIDLTGKHGACIRGQGSLATVIKGVGDYPLIKDEGT